MSGCTECARSPNGYKGCRLLWNCPTYMDAWLQEYRLKHKCYDHREWYREYFRAEVQASEINGNG